MAWRSPSTRAASQSRAGCTFDRDIFSESDFFDLVIFRGTIQHLDEPFLFLKHTFTALKPGGYLAFLATPNTNSPFYRLKKTLPFIDAPRNFYIPDDISLAQTLTNFGFVVRETRYPYLGTPWALIPRGTAQDVDRAVRAAHRAFTAGEWPRMTPTRRGM